MLDIQGKDSAIELLRKIVRIPHSAPKSTKYLAH